MEDTPSSGHNDQEASATQPRANDRIVARQLLDREGPSIRASSNRGREILDSYAKERAKNRDIFDVTYGIREPRTRLERSSLEFKRTGDPRRADEETEVAARPVDEEMLTDLYIELDRKLEAYAAALVAIIKAATDQLDPDRKERDLEKVDALWEDVGLRPSMSSTEISTTTHFLTRLRARNGQLVTVRNESAENSHDLVLTFLDLASRMWQSHVSLALRSQTDPRYTNAVHAVELAHSRFVEDKERPLAHQLRSALKLEYQHAKGELDRSGMDEPSLSVEVTRFSASAIEQLSPPKTSESEIWMNRQDLGPLLYNRARQAQGPNRRQKVKRKEIDGKAHFLLQDIAKHWRNDLSSYLEQCLSGRHPLGHGRN